MAIFSKCTEQVKSTNLKMETEDTQYFWTIRPLLLQYKKKITLKPRIKKPGLKLI